MKTRTWTAAAAAASALAMLLAGCGSGGGATGDGQATLTKEPAAGVDSSYTGKLPKTDPMGRYDNPQPRDNIKDGGTLTLAIGTLGPNWNQLSTDGNNQDMADLWNWYQPNIIMTDEVSGSPTKPNPDYLTDMKLVSENPEVVEYDINPKATWNNGRPIDYTDFVATWKALNGSNPDYNPPATTGFENIKSVERGDSDKQVIVTFAKPTYPWETVFYALVNADAADPKTFTQGWVKNPHNEWAAGPFKVGKLTDSELTFVRNEKWWGDKPKLDKIVYKLMESKASTNAFQNGEIDAASAGDKDRLQQLRSVKGTQLRYGSSTQVNVLIYNGKSAALKDIAVRKAITQGFDRKTWNKISYQGMDWDAPQPGSEILMPFQKGYEDNMPKDSGYSVANAKKTLEQAGYTMGKDGYFEKGGKTLAISIATFGDSATTTNTATAYVAMMKAIGVKCAIDNKPTAKFNTTITDGDYEVLTLGWSGSDPHGFITALPQFYASDGPSNFSFIGTKEVDALLPAAGQVESYDEQTKAANKAEKAALALYGTIPVSVAPNYTAVKKGLANYGGPRGFASVLPQNVGWQK